MRATFNDVRSAGPPKRSSTVAGARRRRAAQARRIAVGGEKRDGAAVAEYGTVLNGRETISVQGVVHAEALPALSGARCRPL